MAKKVVVVRVGGKTIHIVHMENSASNPTIYGCVRIPTPANAVKDGMIVDITDIARRIKKACSEKGIRTKDVIFAVASGKIASRETSIPVVNKTKVSQLVMAKVADLFPVDTDKYIFSHSLQGKEYEDNEGEQVQDVLVFAAPSELIDSYYSLANAVGMNIVSIEADGNSVFQIMKRQVQKGVSMSIQINRESTLINIISSDKLLLQRVIPYGVNVFAEVMTQESVFQAENYEKAYQVLSTQRVLLHNLGTANPEQDFSLSKRIEVTDNGSYLVSNIGRVIEYFNSRYKDQPIDEIICTGQGCSIAGIHELLSNELGISVYTPEQLQGVRFNRKVVIDAAILQYINCFGAVFDPVNFVSKDILQKKAKKGTLNGAVTVFVACLVLSVGLAGFSLYQVYTAKQDRDFWKGRNEALAPIQNEYNSLMQIETNYNMINILKQMLNTNNNNFHSILNKISSVCPKTFKIQSVKTDETKVTISATSTDRLLTLSALQIQMNKISDIKNVKIDEISETKEALSKKKQYSYTLTFEFSKAAKVSNTEGEG